MEDKYIRVGTTLYKVVPKPLLSGDYMEVRVVWNYDTFRRDYAADSKPEIEKYDGFCCVPSHTNYQRKIGTFLNDYEPLEMVPQQGDYPKVEAFLHHIFGEQYELGLDYLQLLYTEPRQRLPILLLVSKERNTGKTTFLNLLKVIFGGNMTFNTNEDFHNQFNSDWANKLIVGVDEVLLNRQEDSERLKNLSTAKNYKAEAKGKDRIEIEFFAKFVLCSNNENNPVIIEPGELRYWVLKIRSIARDNNNLLDEMKKEIPHLLYFLVNRQLSTFQESRMWFNAEIISTAALCHIVKHNKGKVENEMIVILSDLMQQVGVDCYQFTPSDMATMLELRQIKSEHQHIRRVLKESWGLSPTNSVRYTSHLFTYDGGTISSSKTGRVYSVTKSQIDQMLLECDK